MRWSRLTLTIVTFAVLIVGVFLTQQRDAPPSPGSTVVSREPDRSSARGLPQTGTGASVVLSALPTEAQTTYGLIRKGGPFPYSKDGATFQNRERLLPARKRGYYTEYTVPTPRARDRGARRIVAGGDPLRSDEFWYTDDHYRSFRRIRE